MRKLWQTPEINGLNFSEAEVSEAIKGDKPLLLTLYTPAICNARCPSCFITNTDPDYLELSTKDDVRIIHEAAEMGIRSIKISGAGEPLIFADLINIIDQCANESIIPVIYTNGSTLGDDTLCENIYKMKSIELIRFLMSRNCSIVYKCNSFSVDTQDYLLGVKGLSANTYKGLLNLMLMGYNDNQRLALQTIITPYNFDEIVQLYRFARKNNITPYFETVLKKGDAKNNTDLYLSDEQIRDIFIKLCEMDMEEFGIEWFPVPSYVGFQCTELGYALLIDNFGYAKYCPGIWKSIANIHDMSLKEIWESDTAKAFRARVNKPMGGKCSECIHKKEGKCGYGCRAYSYLNEGDVFAEYKECWR